MNRREFFALLSGVVSALVIPKAASANGIIRPLVIEKFGPSVRYLRNAFVGAVVKYPTGGTHRDADGVEVKSEPNYCTGGVLFCPSGSDEHGKPLWEIHK